VEIRLHVLRAVPKEDDGRGKGEQAFEHGDGSAVCEIQPSSMTGRYADAQHEYRRLGQPAAKAADFIDRHQR
jgi:hypothetical protein